MRVIPEPKYPKLPSQLALIFSRPVRHGANGFVNLGEQAHIVGDIRAIGSAVGLALKLVRKPVVRDPPVWFDERGKEMVRCNMAPAIVPQLNLNARWCYVPFTGEIAVLDTWAMARSYRLPALPVYRWTL